MLVEVNSCDVSAFEERSFDDLMICPSHVQESPIVVYNECLLTMINEVCACGGQITEVTSNSRSYIRQDVAGIKLSPLH